MWPGQWGISYPEARAAVAKRGEGGRWARGSLCTGGFCNDWFPATCEFGSGIQASNKGPDLIRNPMPVALGCQGGRGGACLCPPKGCWVMLAHSLGGRPDTALLLGSWRPWGLATAQRLSWKSPYSQLVSLPESPTSSV